MWVYGVPGKDGRVEVRDMDEERCHIFVLGLEAVRHLRGDADLVLASKLEALCLFSDFHEEPYTLFFRGGVCFDHINEAIYFGSESMDGGGEYGIELAKVSELARDI